MQPERQYILEVLSEPNGAFTPSGLYPVSGSMPVFRKLQQAGSNATAAATEDEEHEWLESAVMSSEKLFEPSTLASGSSTAFHRLVVTAPAGVKVLSSAEEERATMNAGADHCSALPSVQLC